jgi:hypothetical protein
MRALAKESMTQGRIVEDKFWAQCRQCGVWQEVLAEPKEADLYFEYWQAFFPLFRTTNRLFTIEKLKTMFTRF